MSPFKDRNAAYARPIVANNTGMVSYSKNGESSRRRSSRHTSFRIWRVAESIYATDFCAVFILMSMVTIYILVLEGGGAEVSRGLPMAMQTRTFSVGSSSIDGPSLELESKDGLIHPMERYEGFHEDVPECHPLEYYEVTFGLAIALNESDLSLVSHHCRRWGISAPISIAVWTELTPGEVMEKLQQFDENECHPNQMTISTLSPVPKANNYPLNKLRNLAIHGLETTHVISVDIRVVVSTGLYDTLHSPVTVRELAKDPKLAIVIPAFQTSEISPRSNDPLQGLPDTFESLIMQLTAKKVNIMGPDDIALQGSTLYRSWVKQEPGDLLSIDCVTSDYYEPFLAVRYCEGLPPFQEVLTYENNGNPLVDTDEIDDSRHDLMSTWILHLMHLGYRFEQVGGGFVVNMPTGTKEKDSPSKTDYVRAMKGPLSSRRTLRKGRNHKQKFTRQTFLHWLHQTVQDKRTMGKCDDYEGSTN